MNLTEDVLIGFCASILIWFLFAGLIILWFIDGKIKKEQVIHALFASFIAWVIGVTLKHFFPTTRPYMTNGFETDVLIPPINGSFPSEHMTWAFAISVTVFMHDRRVGWYFLAIAIFIGIARVLANVHYPVDIIGGAFLGTLSAVLVEKIHLFNFLNDLIKKKKQRH